MVNPAPFIARARARLADVMTTTVAVRRRSDEGTFDPDTASYGPPVETDVWAGPALVRPQREMVNDAGEQTIVLNTWRVKLPADSPVEIGDAIEVTGSAHDAGLVGAVLRVADVRYDEWQVAREVTATAERDRPV